jgi:hypothetical protein
LPGQLEQQYPGQLAAADGEVRRQPGGTRRGTNPGLPRGEEEVRGATLRAAPQVLRISFFS